MPKKELEFKEHWSSFITFSYFANNIIITHFCLSVLTEPEASSEELPSADEEQAASSATAAEAEGTEARDKIEPTENGVKSEGTTEDKGGEGAEKKKWVSPES